MTLEDIKWVLDSTQLSDEGLRSIREHIERLERRKQTKALLAALDELVEGLSEDPLYEMEQAINMEYIKPW